MFAQDQVAPLPPPAVPAPLACPIRELNGDDLAPARPRLSALCAELAVGVRFQEIPGAANGCYEIKNRRITIDCSLSANAQLSTLCHELAHALMRLDRQAGDPELDYAAEELVAESVAYTCVSSLGISADESSIPYLADWALSSDLAVLEQTAGLIDRLAARIETALHLKDAADTEHARKTQKEAA